MTGRMDGGVGGIQFLEEDIIAVLLARNNTWSNGQTYNGSVDFNSNVNIGGFFILDVNNDMQFWASAGGSSLMELSAGDSHLKIHTPIDLDDGITLLWTSNDFQGSITSSDASMIIAHAASAITITGEDGSALFDFPGAWQTTGNLSISNTSPGLQFTDTTASEDDYSITLNSSTLTFKNTTDNANDITIGGTGLITLIGRGGLTSNANLVFSKNAPFIRFTDSGGDDWDFGVTSNNYFKITNTTDGREDLVFSGTGEGMFGGQIGVHGIAGSTFKWNSSGLNPTPNLTPAFTAYYGGNVTGLGFPATWAIVNISGTHYKLPAYA